MKLDLTAMKNVIVLAFILFCLNAYSGYYDRIKVFNRANSIEIGLYLACPFNGLSQTISPNTLITRTNNHFDIMLSLNQSWFARCSPLPPQFVDKIRNYYSLGNLQPGTYTVKVVYVINNSIPPDPSVSVFDFAEKTFNIAHPIPTLNWFNKIFLFSLFFIITVLSTRKKPN